MKVLKFGGGCLKDVKSIYKLPSLLRQYNQDIIIVISAFGKLTNLLESIYCSKNKSFNTIQMFLKNTMLGLNFNSKLIDKILTESSSLYSSNSSCEAGFLSIGELVSSRILSEYLIDSGINHKFWNASKIIKTKNIGVNANVDLPQTLEKINFERNRDLGKKISPILTQGFISGFGEDSTFETTCLGREGSDYSAAIFGSALDADQIILFKDVDGIYSSDPKKDGNAKLFSHLNYNQAFKICNNQNTIIHPKTINHLKQKKIPLLIKNFNDLTRPGTIIS